jgi:hypothetical protein
VLTEREQKLLRLALDPAAPTGEYSVAATKFIESLRKRSFQVDQLTSPGRRAPKAKRARRKKPPEPDYGEYLMPFGRYKGYSLRHIYARDPGYLEWVAENCTGWPRVVEAVRKFLEKCHE